jgi:hypothetical protein
MQSTVTLQDETVLKVERFEPFSLNDDLVSVFDAVTSMKYMEVYGR